MTLSGTVVLLASCWDFFRISTWSKWSWSLSEIEVSPLPPVTANYQSRLRRLKNGVPQGSVLAPLLFNIYTYDLSSMISRKFAYADDLALLHSSGNWKDLEGTLSQDMSTLSAYLQTWRLKLSQTRTVTAAFHLNNREAKRELKVYNNSRILPFCPTPTYLGVKLDRSPTFRHHLVALRKKLSSRVTLLRWLVGSGWGAGAKTLRIATLSLVYSTAEYCAPVWCCSAHTRLIDSVLNDALCIVTGCLCSTTTDHLSILSDIQPAELRRLGATLSLAHRGFLDPDHILYSLLSGSSDTRQVRLRSRRPFVPAAWNLLDNLAKLFIRASEWTNHKWNTEYCENASRLRAFVPKTGARPVGMGLPRAAWILPKVRPPADWCRAIPFVHAQMGSRSFTELRVWRLWANRRPCFNSVPYTSGITWSTRSDGFGWRNSMLA